ncbi:MAG TPA: hypothetical protein VFI29_11210 [Hanamia sp.]|nr:hypothetical protein [Hanamia sp.]
MRKINCISTWLLTGLLSCTYVTQAQKIKEHASLTVKESNGKTVTYNYPDDFPNTLYNCQQTGSEGSKISHTDFGFSKTFDQFKNEDGDPPIVTVQMRIGPSGVGTFPLKTTDSDQPQGDLQIDLNSPAHPLNDFDNDTNGSITISEYPAVGSFIVGSFKATLKDAAGKSYAVNGTFRIKRQSNTE